MDRLLAIVGLCVALPAWSQPHCGSDHVDVIKERASGTAVERAAVLWWEVFGNLKWAVICIMQAQTFLNGVGNVELAALGRRIVETELELLDLMEAP